MRPAKSCKVIFAKDNPNRKTREKPVRDRCGSDVIAAYDSPSSDMLTSVVVKWRLK